MVRATLRLQKLQGHLLAPGERSRARSSRCAAQDARRPVAVVLGAGAGIGQGVARKFAEEGYHVVPVRRGQGKDRLLKPDDDSARKLEAFAESIGGTARFCDVTSPEDVAALFQDIEANIGPIHFINYNIGAQVGDRPLEATSYRVFELAWRMGTLGALACAKEAARYMVPRGHGTIVYTSATAAMRGRELQHAHTAAMGGRRMLTQSLAAELGPKGIHIAHVNVDGLVNAPETAGAFADRIGGPGTFAKVVERGRAEESLVEPAGVADTYYHLHTQPRGVWSQELDLKPWTTKAWFSNSETNATRLFDKGL